MQNYLFLHRLVLSEFHSVSGDSMFLSGILGMILWIMFRRWFKSYKYPYQLFLRIVVQICIVGIITLISTTIISPPRSYGDYSIFLPLSFPLMLHWVIPGLLPVFPPNQYFYITVFGFSIEGGLLESGSELALREIIFLNSVFFF